MKSFFKLLVVDHKLRDENIKELEKELNQYLQKAFLNLKIEIKRFFYKGKDIFPDFSEYCVIFGHINNDDFEDFTNELKKNNLNQIHIVGISGVGSNLVDENANLIQGLNYEDFTKPLETGEDYKSLNWSEAAKQWIENINQWQIEGSMRTIPNFPTSLLYTKPLTSYILAPFISIDILLQGYLYIHSQEEIINNEDQDPAMRNKLVLALDLIKPEKLIQLKDSVTFLKEGFWFDECVNEMNREYPFSMARDRELDKIIAIAKENFRSPNLDILRNNSKGHLRIVWDILRSHYAEDSNEKNESLNFLPDEWKWSGGKLWYEGKEEKIANLLKSAHDEFRLACRKINAYLARGKDAFGNIRNNLYHNRYKNSFLSSVLYLEKDKDEKKDKIEEALTGDKNKKQQLKEAFKEWANIKEEIFDFIDNIPERKGYSVSGRFRNEANKIKKHIDIANKFIDNFLKNKANLNEKESFYNALDEIKNFFEKIRDNRKLYIEDVFLTSSNSE